MSALEEVHIWKSDTGILDLPEDWPSLAVPETQRIRFEWQHRREEAAGSEQLAKFTEQLHREWAIETGIIENLYDINRGVTTTLIEHGFSAAVMVPGTVDKDPDYILGLLEDQKDALEGLFAFVKQDLPLSTSYIKQLHAAMTRSQTSVEAIDPSGKVVQVPMIHGDWKKHPNYPRRGDHVFFYCPPEQTASEMDRLVEMHLKHVAEGIPPEVEAAWIHHRFTQIHPFQDGNGRVARALASLILIRDELFPLVVPRDEKFVYIQALELADQGDLKALTFLISRRQETSFRQAVGILSRFAPESNTPEEAMSRLIDTLVEESPERATSLKRRARSMRLFAQTYMGDRLNQLQRMSHEAELGSSLSSNFDDNGAATIPQFRLDQLRGFWGIIPIRPFIYFQFEIKMHVTYKIQVWIYAVLGDLSEEMQMVAEEFEPQMGFLPVDPFRWNKFENEETVKKRAVDWIEEVLTKWIDRIRKGN